MPAHTVVAFPVSFYVALAQGVGWCGTVEDAERKQFGQIRHIGCMKEAVGRLDVLGGCLGGWHVCEKRWLVRFWV